MLSVSKVALVLSTLTMACATTSRLAGPRADEPSAIAVRVDNRNWSEVSVYVLHDGVRTRLDNVAATSSAVLHIPARMLGALGDIQLVAEPFGIHGGVVRPVITERIVVHEGQRIEWTLEDALSRSSVGVYNQ